ncbi:MAG TPA: M28 family metallopeptidase [Candidatus Dormibacteraeota bacterium]|nr:M28 family metallopeptidase [Candidatus Dormibacteraeota bacterium]
MTARVHRTALLVGIFAILGLVACGHSSSTADAQGARAAFPPAPPASATGGFDGERAYKQVEALTAIGPHSAGSEGIHRAQAYIIAQLKSFGCPVDEEDFHVPSTPVGDVAMKNIVVKIPSSNPNIILYASHYDTKRIPNFVGADDGGSSTGVLLELARVLCARKNTQTIWLAFFDGEEAFNMQWADPDNTYGSRQMAATLALSGELPRVKAMVLVDMVGPANPVYKRESNSTPWLTDIIWSTAARLGYGNVFVNDRTTIEDDHLSFLSRGVPATDIIDLDVPYWHTTRDTIDKIDPRTLAITGHVLLASLPEIEKKIQ